MAWDRRGMNGFASLRTRPNIPSTEETPAPRYCAQCGAVLRIGNLTEYCALHSVRYRPPVIFRHLCENASDEAIDRLADMLRRDIG